MSAQSAKIVPRRSEERGQADHGWLKTFHTFSFASYQGSGHEQFGSLRVINEDRVAPKTGFGTHSHAEFEIFSYVVSGQLEHKDSMGNTEVISRGDIQLTSAGTGISHSEKAYGPNQVHFLQIWSLPSTRRLQPKYFTRHFPDSAKENKWAHVVAPVNNPEVKNVRELAKDELGPAPVQSPLSMYSTLLAPGKTVKQAVKGSKVYLHVVQTSGYNPLKASETGAAVKLAVGGATEVFREGDGAYVSISGDGPQNVVVENVGDKRAEVLLFDIEA